MALNDKIAVVTGAAMGIGKAITEILLQNGAKVTILDVNEAAGRSLKEDLDKQFGEERTLFLKCDVQSDEQIKAALQQTVETWGGIDILCNNAGILDERQWEKTVSINLVGVIRVTYLALDHMKKLTGGRGGVVVNMASVAGLVPTLTSPAYAASKHGVIGFTRSMASTSLASGYGVRFNAICPSFTQTDLLKTLPESLGQYSHLHENYVTLMERDGVLDVSQVAECLLELVTDETKNGEALMVGSRGKDYVTFLVFP